MYEEIRKSARAALLELLDIAALTPGQQVVIGCSSSEIMGQKIGKGSTPEAAKAVVDEILPILKARGLCLEAQCCEHLNRALIMERADAERFGYEIVCVRPRPKAGGSFATAVYEAMDDPVAVEFVKADAGLDIGNTMIGMHLKHVAVPLRLSVKTIGEALVNAGRTRPKLIGGSRAEYPDGYRAIQQKSEKAHPPAMAGDALFYSCAGNYAPLCIRTVSTSVRTTKTRPNHFVALASLASSVLALPLERNVSAPPAMAPDRPALLPDCISTITVTARPEISWIIVRISSKVVMVFILS